MSDDSSTTPPAAQQSTRRRLLPWALGALVLLAAAEIGVAANRMRDDKGSTAATSTIPTTAATTTAATTTIATTTAKPTAATTTVAKTPVAPTTVAPTPVPSTTVAPTTVPTVAPTTTAAPPTTAEQVPLPGRGATYSGGKVYLIGFVKSQEIADTIARKSALVVGPDNVVVLYVIDPRASDAVEPLRVDDFVLFTPDSATVLPQFRQILDLGVVLLQQNPAVHITIIGHTDSDGTAEYNQALSERRVQAVIDYALSKGIDASRLDGIARGAVDPMGDNSTPDGKRINRRIEFLIVGLLEN